MSIITLTTDFGYSDPYVGMMKGVILSINPSANVIDLTHAIAPQDVRSGFFLLQSSTRYFPPGTVHVAVVDPVQCEELPDVFVVTNRQYSLNGISKTFHGRDVMAPVAAHLSLGADPSDLGAASRNVVRLSLPEPSVFKAGRIEGEVLYVDTFGNLLTNIEGRLLSSLDAKARKSLAVTVAGKRVGPLCEAYSEVPQGSTLAIIGSLGYLEISANQASARQILGAGVGARVALGFSPPKS